MNFLTIRDTGIMFSQNSKVTSVKMIEEQNPLIQCIYASAAQNEFSKDDLSALLKDARQNNYEKNVSGMLLYQNRAFFQILEGPAQEVNKLYEKISLDPRHFRITKILETTIEERSFAEWTMGYANVTYTDLAKIDGLNDFFMGNASFLELKSSRALKLLEAFKEGRWNLT
jgi:blue light- and temperature-responsive anti-repressor